MKIKLLQIFTSWPILQKLSTFEIDGASAIRFQRFLVEAQAGYDIAESIRSKLVDEFGIVIEDNIKVPKEREKDFIDELNKYLQQEVDIYDPQLSSRILEGQRLSAADFFAVLWLFDRVVDEGLVDVVDPEQEREG